MIESANVIGRGRVGSAVAARLEERGLRVDPETPDLVLLCVPAARLPDEGEESDSRTANVRFLSRVAIAVGTANLVLIVLEGLYVVFLDPCARG